MGVEFDGHLAICSKLYFQDRRQCNLVVAPSYERDDQSSQKVQKSLADLMVFNKIYMIEVSKAGSVSALVQMLLAHLVSPRSSGNVTLPPSRCDRELR